MPAYITTTRSTYSLTSAMSWLMRMSAVSCSRVIATSCSSTWAWVVTSSAVVGSSAMSRSGRSIIAIAIMMRWFMPPLSWNG